jgi:hypothetical protein
MACVSPFHGGWSLGEPVGLLAGGELSGYRAGEPPEFGGLQDFSAGALLTAYGSDDRRAGYTAHVKS